MRRLFAAALAVTSLAAFATSASAQRRAARDDRNNDRTDQRDDRKTDDFKWSGPLARGQRLYIYNVVGSIRVEGTRGRDVEIVAHKRYRRSSPDDVKIDVQRVRGDRDVVVCAMWNPRDDSCDERGMHSRSLNRGDDDDRDNDVSVEFEIRLPEGANVSATDVVGAIEVTGVSGDVEAKTVTGSIDAESSDGAVQATAVTGSIHARMARLPSGGADYKTVTGSITVGLPRGANADIDAKTVMGSLESDFPLTVQGRWGPRSAHGTIGRGGPHLSFSTVTGSVKIEER